MIFRVRNGFHGVEIGWREDRARDTTWWREASENGGSLGESVVNRFECRSK